jgi:HEPN domain-containing protein
MIFNILDNYAYPEVMKRISNGKLSHEFKLYNFQLVMFADQTKNQVFLNDEVRFITNIQFRNDVKYRQNEGVKQGDIAKVLGLYSESRNDPNSAHIILFKCNDMWYCSFDLIYDRKRVENRFELAKSFLNASTYCLKSKLFGVFVDTLYSATELAIQSILLLHHHPVFSLNQTHDDTRELFSDHARLGNIDTKFADHYIKLDELRKQGRYLNGTHGKAFSMKDSIAQSLLKTTNELLEVVQKLLKLIDLSKKPPEGHYIAVGRIKQQ